MSYVLDNFISNIPEAVLKTNVDTIDGRVCLKSLLFDILHESEMIQDANWIIKESDNGPYLESFYALTNLSYISLINTPYGKLIVKNARKYK